MVDRLVNRAISDWPRESLAARLERCRRMLAFHGVATDDETRKIQRRIKMAFGVGTRERLRSRD